MKTHLPGCRWAWDGSPCLCLPPLPAAPTRAATCCEFHRTGGNPSTQCKSACIDADTVALTQARDDLRHMLKRWTYGDGAHATYDAPLIEQAILALDTFLRGGKP